MEFFHAGFSSDLSLPSQPQRTPAPEDFAELLRRKGLYPGGAAAQTVIQQTKPDVLQTQATTILALKFKDGVLVAGDRRATAGNIVVYDRADKVLEIDAHSLMAMGS